VKRSALVAALAVLAVCAGAQEPARPAAAAPESPAFEYAVGPRDLLEIRVLEVPELNVERRVTERGTIDLPLLGEFEVRGLSAAQVQDRLERLLTEKYVNRANVSVIVREFANKPVSILGAVQRPGSLNISGRWTVLEAITAAGGLNDRAGKKIYVLRRSDNGLSDTLEISTEELFRSASPMWNIPIFPSDIVNIPPRTTVNVICLGEVKNPGTLQFQSDERLTLLAVIAKAGGLSDRASKTIMIRRRRADGNDVEQRVDYKRVLSGKESDPEIFPDDVVVVKESFF
jgi:polysaccharide export outer membrane protein